MMRSALGTVHGDAGREQVAPCPNSCGDFLQFGTDHFGRLVASCPTCTQRGRREAVEARRHAVLEERQRVAAALEADRLEREREQTEATTERRRLADATRRAARKQGGGAADRVCLCRSEWRAGPVPRHRQAADAVHPVRPALAAAGARAPLAALHPGESLMATFNPAGHLAGAPRGSQADALDGVVPQMEAELRALSAPALRPPGDWPGEEGSKELAEAVGVLRQHIDARYDCTCSRCTALAVVLRDRDAQVHRGNEWKRYAELLQRGLLEIAKRSNHHRRTAEQRGAALRDLILAVVKFWGPPANIQDHSEATPAQAELLAALDRAEAGHAEVAP